MHEIDLSLKEHLKRLKRKEGGTLQDLQEIDDAFVFLADTGMHLTIEEQNELGITASRERAQKNLIVTNKVYADVQEFNKQQRIKQDYENYLAIDIGHFPKNYELALNYGMGDAMANFLANNLDEPLTRTFGGVGSIGSVVAGVYSLVALCVSHGAPSERGVEFFENMTFDSINLFKQGINSATGTYLSNEARKVELWCGYSKPDS